MYFFFGVAKICNKIDLLAIKTHIDTKIQLKKIQRLSCYCSQGSSFKLSKLNRILKLHLTFHRLENRML